MNNCQWKPGTENVCSRYYLYGAFTGGGTEHLEGADTGAVNLVGGITFQRA